MGWTYKAKEKKNSGFNSSYSKRGLNVSYTMDFGFCKVNTPLIGKRRKKRVTAKGSGLFSRFF